MRNFIFLPLLSLILSTHSISLMAEESCAPILPSGVTLTEARKVVLESKWKRAIDQDKAEDIKQLLPDVDVSVTNDKGKTALMAAVKLGDFCLLQNLLQRGLKISDTGYTGGTTLMYAVLGNQSEMIERMLTYMPDLDAQSTNGWTSVMIAAAKGFDSAISALHKAGADLDLADVYGWTPLMRAIDNRHSGVVQYLLAQPDLDVQQVNENGSTALHIASQAGDDQTVGMLLQLDASTIVKDKNGLTAADIASANNNLAIVELILKSAQ